MGRHTGVVLPGAPGEDLEKAQVAGMLWRVPQSLDGGGLQQLGEDIGVGRRGSLGDEVGGGAGRIGRLGEGQEGLESVEGACLLHGKLG